MPTRSIMRNLILLFLPCLALTSAALAAGPTLIVQAPAGAKVVAGVARSQQLKLDVKGSIDGGTVIFANLLPDTSYDVRLELADGTVLQGVDMSWYTLEPPRKDEQPMDEDDTKQIKELFEGVQAFENKRSMLIVHGSHDRAVVLAELIRDNGFHSDKGGEIIWRVEVWFYKNQHGGWERISQSERKLRRERFANPQAYKKETEKLKWLEELGGIRLKKDEKKTVATK